MEKIVAVAGTGLARSEPLDVLRHEVGLEIDLVARLQRAERRRLERVRDERDGEPSSASAATVNDTPDTATDPFSTQYRSTGSGASTTIRLPAPSGSTDRTVPTASTCPWTMWPPSGSPARTAASTLTRAPAAMVPSVERSRGLGNDVERTRRLRHSATTVRQTPSTAIESPTLAATDVATTSRLPSKDTTLP